MEGLMPPLLLLDLDGTLVDTLGYIFGCFRESVRPLVKRLPSDEEIVATFGPSEVECIGRLLSRYERESLLNKRLSDEQVVACGVRFHELYRAGYASGHVRLYDGMSEVLQKSRSSGWSLGIFTGKGRISAMQTLEHLRLQSAFDVIVTSDDVSRPKPAPEGVLLAARQVSTSPERTFFVGDNPADVIAANEAGATSIAALWGSFNKEQTLNAHPDYVLSSPHELVSLLPELLINGQ